MTDNNDLAYAAGVIDSDGTITILKRSGQRGYRLGVRVVQTNPVIPIWFLIKFGGGFRSYQPKQPNHKTVYVWFKQDRKAGIFLRSIRPHLRLKKPQAEAGISLQEIKAHNSGRSTPEVVLEAQAILHDKIVDLHSK